ncbi:hypothetical protein C8J57DRAFT_1238553 [Mycena rebaudengoi]|nr:hypothetical protein C8J57DRAFT_1238553 [Mycena rebaudengoi]
MCTSPTSDIPSCSTAGVVGSDKIQNRPGRRGGRRGNTPVVVDIAQMFTRFCTKRKNVRGHGAGPAPVAKRPRGDTSEYWDILVFLDAVWGTLALQNHQTTSTSKKVSNARIRAERTASSITIGLDSVSRVKCWRKRSLRDDDEPIQSQLRDIGHLKDSRVCDTCFGPGWLAMRVGDRWARWVRRVLNLFEIWNPFEELDVGARQANRGGSAIECGHFWAKKGATPRFRKRVRNTAYCAFLRDLGLTGGTTHCGDHWVCTLEECCVVPSRSGANWYFVGVSTMHTERRGGIVLTRRQLAVEQSTMVEERRSLTDPSMFGSRLSGRTRSFLLRRAEGGEELYGQ